MHGGLELLKLRRKGGVHGKPSLLSPGNLGNILQCQPPYPEWSMQLVLQAWMEGEIWVVEKV